MRDLEPQYHRMLTIISRRMASRPVSYETVIALIDRLLLGLSPTVDERQDACFTESSRLQAVLHDADAPLLMHRQEADTYLKGFLCGHRIASES